MSRKQRTVEHWQLAQPADTDRCRPALQLMAAAEAPLGTVAAVVIGGVIGGMPAMDILICGLVAGGGVALFCAVAAWLFDAPLGPSLTGLWDDFGQLRPLRFRRSRHADRPARADAPPRPSSTSDAAHVAVGVRHPNRRLDEDGACLAEGFAEV